MSSESVYTIQEIASILKISEKTVYRLVKNGELPILRVRRRIRITSKALEQFLEGGRHE
jgi:excisionase family DNA binding protein